MGGKSKRFGSDKGLFELKGKPIISYQLDILAQLDYNIFLIANSKQQVARYIEKIKYELVTAFIIDDQEILLEQHIHSPMLGLYSAFKELDLLGYKKLFVLACDIPLIQNEVVKLLIKESQGFDCCIPKWNNGFLEPLFAIYPIKKAFLKAEENLKKKAYKLINLLDKNWKIQYVSIEKFIKPVDRKLLSFLNINRQTDIEKLMELSQNN
ncbi:MAG: molybdenum cofactor guanylyltransferase [Candidatus Hodarchaeota archaeon]